MPVFLNFRCLPEYLAVDKKIMILFFTLELKTAIFVDFRCTAKATFFDVIHASFRNSGCTK